MIESPRPDLDEAIDRVAAKLVEVPGDDQFLSRTIAQLPERSVTPWFLTMPAQVTLAAALVLLAFVYAAPRVASPDEARLAAARVAPGSTQPNAVSSGPVAAAFPDPRSPFPDPRSPVPDPRSPIPDPRSPIPDPRSLIPDPRSPIPVSEDHERSLAPVAAIDAIELIGIAPPAMALDPAAALEPLVVPELALDTRGDS